MAPPSTPDKHISGEHFDEIVRVTVGADQGTEKTFEVHKGILCFYSGYFEAALNRKWKEASSRIVELDTESPEVFERVRNWMYSRNFCLTSAPERQAGTLDWRMIMKLWVFGDAHVMPLMQNRLADLLVEKVILTWVVPTTEIQYVYENTLSGSALRRLVMDLVGYLGSAEKLMAPYVEKITSSEALVDLLRIVWQEGHTRQHKDGLWKWDVCSTYHVHEKDVSCSQGFSGFIPRPSVVTPVTTLLRNCSESSSLG